MLRRLLFAAPLALTLAIPSLALASMLLLGAGSSGLPPATCFYVGSTGTTGDPGKWSNATGGAGNTCAGPNGVPGVIDTAILDGASGGGTVTTSTPMTVASLTFGAFTGTFTTNTTILTAGSISGTGTATRTFNITNSTVNVTGTGSVWNFTTVTGLTFTSTNSTININGNGARTLNFGALTYADVNVTGTGAITSGNQNAVFDDLVIVKGGSMIVGNWTMASLFLSGNSQTDRLLIGSSATGTQRTLTPTSFSVSNVDFTNITKAGAALTGTSIGDAGGNVNITFTPAVDRFWVQNGGPYSGTEHWSATSGGANGATMPLPQDRAIFDANSFSLTGQTVGIDVPRIGGQDWSAVTNTPTLALANNITMHGDFDVPFGTGAVVASGNFTSTIAVQTGTMDLNIHLPAISAVGGQTVLDHGFVGSVTIQSPGGTVALGDNFLTQGTFTHNAGTLTTNDFDLQATHFASAGTSTRVVNPGSSRFLSSSNSGTGQAIFNFTATGITVNANTARLETFSGSSSVRIVNLAGLTFGAWLDWYHDGLFNSAEVQINGGATFTGAFQVDASNLPRSYTVQTGTTITVGSLTAGGQGSGSRLTMQSSTATPFAWSDAAGTNTCNFCTIINSTAGGGGDFNATNSTSSGTTTGWNITP